MREDVRTTDWYKWAVVAMLWLVCFFNYADRQGIFSVFAVLQDKEKGFGLTDAQLGLIASAFMWVYAGTGWFAGMVGDRLPRKGVILGGFLFWSVITLLFGFATQYWHLVALRAIEGLGEAFYFPAAMAMISAYHTPRTRSRAMGIHQTSVYAGTIVGGTVAGLMGQHYGWQSSFFVFGGCGMLVGLLLMLFLKEPPREMQMLPAIASETAVRPKRRTWLESIRAAGLEAGSALKGVADLYRIPMVVVLTAVFIGANFVAAIFISWMPKFLNNKFQMSLSMAGFNATVYLQVGSMMGAFFGGWLADRLIRRYRGGRPMTQALGLFCGVPFVFLVGWTLQVPVLVVAMAFFGIFKGIYDSNIWASLHDVVPPERRATAVGVMNSLAWFGGASGTLLIGLGAKRFGLSQLLSATSLIYLVFGLLLAWGIWAFMRGRPEEAAAPAAPEPVRPREPIAESEG